MKLTRFTKQLIITSFVAGILLVLTNSAIWINRQVFDSKNFTNTASAALLSDSSRTAIGSRITSLALKDRPVIANVVGDTATKLISGLLDTQQSEKIVRTSLSKLQIYLTSNNQKDVVLELGSLNTILTRLVELTGNERIDPSSIPNRIVLVKASNVPDVYQYALVLNWLAPLLFLLAVALIAFPYWMHRTRYVTIMGAQGIMLICVSITCFLVGPLISPVVLGPFGDPNGRIIIGNLYDAFIATFNAQTMTILYVGLSVCLLAVALKYFPQLKKLARVKTAR